ncbi:hypothetical protein [Sphaerisporangium album]|uniref:hypothetical protein n=1 Tax=Sphaerisporangium album TaxID=509200 RepID=UPI0011C0203F|nr:hypothetical protein [Sphaerisporangium album]
MRVPRPATRPAVQDGDLVGTLECGRAVGDDEHGGAAGAVAGGAGDAFPQRCLGHGVVGEPAGERGQHGGGGGDGGGGGWCGAAAGAGQPPDLPPRRRGGVG